MAEVVTEHVCTSALQRYTTVLVGTVTIHQRCDGSVRVLRGTPGWRLGPIIWDDLLSDICA